MLFPREQWKDIEGYEGLYQVSSTGRVRSLDRVDCAGNLRKGNIKIPSLNSKGYLNIHLWKDGRRKSCRVHQLVANAFVPNLENKPQIDHINTIKTDNYYKNLRWCTPIENSHNELSRQHHLEAVRSEDFRRKVSIAHKRENLSEETRRKISEAHKGKVISEEHRRKIGEASKKRCGEKSPMFGRHLSEETKRKISEAHKGENSSLSKKVEIFKENISLGVFPCTMELERKSEELFGTKLFGTAISAVCLGKLKQYKGYTFRYVNK